MTLTVLISDPAADSALRLPALETLLTRADARPAAGGMEGVLEEIFRLPPDSLAVAPLTYLADTGKRGNEFWFRADPVHLVADRDRLVMLPLSQLDLRPEEAQELAESFNRLYADDGYRLEIPLPSRWYLRMPESVMCVTHAPAQVAGQSIYDFMPTGQDAVRIKQLMNEIQMLFHEHPVNLAREEAGKSPVNSLWLWGGGRLPEPVTGASGKIITNMPLARGLALLAGSECVAWTGSPMMDTPIESAGLFALRGDDGDALKAIETGIAEPLLTGLRKGAVSSVEVYPGGGRIYRLTHAGLRRFWRRRRPFASILESA